jgi:subtilisin family serine protease
VIVACAGNAGSDRPFWPAALKRVVAVAALDAKGQDRAEFSNYGWWVDACAIGDKVVSSFFKYDAHTPVGEELFDGYAAWSGTSFAAPNVAGVIAAYAARHGFSTSRAAAIILDPSSHRSMPDLGVLVDAARPSRRR